MKRWVFGVLIGLWVCSSALAGEGIAIVKQAQGKVSVKRSGEIIGLALSDKLQSGDILITGSGGRVGVIFHDGSVLALEENSLLRIKAFEFRPLENRFKFNLQLKKGTSVFESGKIGTLAPEDFSFEVPEGTIGIRGTKFLVEVK